MLKYPMYMDQHLDIQYFTLNYKDMFEQIHSTYLSFCYYEKYD